jgi:hypothetical protein
MFVESDDALKPGVAGRRSRSNFAGEGRRRTSSIERTRKSGTGRQSLARARNLIAAWRMMRERDTLGVSVMTRPVGRALPRDVAGAKRRGIATHSGPTLIEGMEAAIVRIRVVPSAPFRSFGRRPI